MFLMGWESLFNQELKMKVGSSGRFRGGRASGGSFPWITSFKSTSAFLGRKSGLTWNHLAPYLPEKKGLL